MKITWIFMLIFFVSACNSADAPQMKKAQKALTANQAIELAEQYLIKQGYTNQPTDITIDQAVLEPGEYATDIEKLLKTRKNFLQLPAYGARQYGEFKKWAVAFSLVVEEENIGRAVSMDSLGNNIRLDPSPVRLDWIDEWEKDRIIDSLKAVHPDFVPNK